MKKFKINSIILFLILLIFISNNLFSQITGSIKGVVRDSASGEMLPFVSIQVLGTKLGTVTNNNGLYLLKGIPKGYQSIQASAVGYKKITKKILIEKDEIQTLNFNLPSEAVELQSVTKIADRIIENYSTNISLQKISIEDMKNIPSVLEKDIFRALRSVPGISTTGDVTSQFFVRGGKGDQNLIVYDNMIIFNPFHALGLFSIFDAEAIKSSEIYTGGFDPEFGGKLSSVINITTKDGNRNRYGGKVSLGTLSTSASFEGPLPGGSFYLSGRKSVFNSILKKLLKKDVPLSFYDISGKATLDMGETGKISLNSFFSGDNLDASKPTDPEFKWRTSAIGVNLQSIFSQVLITTNFSYSDFSLEEKKKEKTSSSGINNFQFFIKFEYLFPNNDLISAGFSASVPETDLDYKNSYNIPIIFYSRLSEKNFWIKYKFSQINNLVIEAGLRNNLNNYENKDHYNLEPRVNIKYQILHDLSLKASFTRMHQMLVSTINEDDIVPLFESFVSVGKYNPERADQFVAGVDFNLFSRINVVLQAYQKKMKNLLGYNINRKSKDESDFSSGYGSSKGFETLIRFDYDIINGWLSYNYNWTKTTIDVYTFFPRYDKRHSLSIISGIKLPYNINFNINWEFSTGMPFTPIIGIFEKNNYENIPLDPYYNNYTEHYLFGEKNSKRLLNYHRLDIGFEKRIIFENLPSCDVSLNFINLYDRKNIFYFDKNTLEKVYMIPFMVTFSISLIF